MSTIIQKPSVITDNFKKGELFEKYIIDLFNKDHFWLLDWQNSQRRANVDQLDLNYPDLYLVFSGRNKYRFAVECKYASSFGKEKMIRWAKPNQIKTYLYYRAKFNIPVFIAIGVGGHPSGPEKLYVTHLENIAGDEYVHENQLSLYKRKPTSKFFYDTKQFKLF